jgi:hypothetical protein
MFRKKMNFEEYTKLDKKINEFIRSKTQDTIIISLLPKKMLRFVVQNEQLNIQDILNKTEHIIHFIENIDQRDKQKQLKGNFEQINSNAEKWSVQLQKQGAKLKDKQEEGLNTLMQFKDGFQIVQLTTKDHCKREGNLMGHCVGGYDPKTKTILSLRDSQNQPHVTLEIKNENEVHQIKGKSNKAPIPKYQKYIRYFLKKNLQYIVSEDGRNIGYVNWKKRYYDLNSQEWLSVYENEIKPVQEWALNNIFEEAKNNNGVVKKIILNDLYLSELPQWMEDIKVNGNFSCSDNRLTTLQGVPQKVGGSFSCTGNRLTTLQGAPQKVGGSFSCTGNRLTTLQGAPQKVGGSFYCNNNQLTTLKGAPKEVGGSFFCNNNRLTTLQGAPQEVGGQFYCGDNQLKTLQGAPQKVGDDFYCSYNRLTTLQGAPKEVGCYFYCNDNQLTSLQGAPQKVGGAFYCNDNTVKFTEGQVRSICEVGGDIRV